MVCIITGTGVLSSLSGVGNSNTNWNILKAYNKIRQSQKARISPMNSSTDLDYSNVIVSINSLGITKTRILSLISKKSDYAYNLNKRMYNTYKSKDKKKAMAMSTLYQHLNELEQLRMIIRDKAESFRGRPIRFYYDVTVNGIRALENKTKYS
ncbi:MAG: helix-turn-helix transcriptional regulator [Nitrososphaeraceae archaeon]